MICICNYSGIGGVVKRGGLFFWGLVLTIQKSSRPTCRLTGKAFWPLFGREVSVAAFLGCAWEPELGMEWVVRDGRPLFAGCYAGLGSHCREEMYTSVWREQNYLFWAE